MTHCQAPVPERLRGDLRPSNCLLEVGPDGTHTGDHKAHMSVPRLGKITWRWKNHATPVRIMPGPPVVKLERASNPYLTGEMRKAKCGCPDWWTSHGHTRPCRLA